MKHSFFIAAAAAFFVFGYAGMQAQSVITKNIYLTDPSSGYQIKINGPGSLTGNINLTLPSSAGTLLTTTNVWALGGNDLTSAGPTDNRIGSTSAHDVELIANSTVRATLLEATNAIQTGAGTELRLLEPSGSEFTALVAQDQANNITYTLPATIGAAGEVLAIAASPVPTATSATLEWVSVGSSSSSSTTITKSATENFSSGTYSNVTDLSMSVTAGKMYVVSFVVEAVKTSGSGNPNVQVEFVAAPEIVFHFSTSNGETGNQSTNNVQIISGVTGTATKATITGILYSPVNGTIQLQARRSGGGGGSPAYDINATNSYVTYTEL